MATIDVLLVSPRLPSADRRFCGDHAYTEALMHSPPAGVRYSHYEDLMATGQVAKLQHLYRLAPRLVRWGVLPPDLWAEYVTVRYRPDLIHIYGFSAVVRPIGAATPVPVVLGSGTGSYSDLRYYHGWGTARIRRARRAKRLFLRLVDAHDSSLRPEEARRVLVWSNFSRLMHLEEGYVKPGQIEVLYPGLPWRGGSHRVGSGSGAVTFLFVGLDFVRKNGQSVLNAFRTVRQSYPASRLVMVTTTPDGRPIQEPGVTHLPFVPRSELMNVVYPAADVLLLPSRAEGFGLVLLEAMSFGVPAIGVDAWAMPEVIQDGFNGFLIPPGDVQELAARMTLLAGDQERYYGLRHRAEALFRTRFSIDVHNQRLAAVYRAALSA